MLTDGNHDAVFHLDTAPAPGAAYDVDLGTEIAIDKIQIWPRQDGCCPERFTNLRISVHKDASGKIGDSTWHADIFTDGSNPGSARGTLVTLTPDLDATGTFKGQWVRIESLDNPVPDYGLQMTELEVFGHPTAPIVVRPRIDFVRSATELRLTWTSGALESAADVTGPFSPVQNAASPFDATLKAPRSFYRLKQ